MRCSRCYSLLFLYETKYKDLLYPSCFKDIDISCKDPFLQHLMCLWFCLFLFVYPCLLSTSNLLRKQHTNLSLKSTSSRWQVYECRCWVSISVRCLFNQCVYIVNRSCQEFHSPIISSETPFRKIQWTNDAQVNFFQVVSPFTLIFSPRSLGSFLYSTELSDELTNFCPQWDNFEDNCLINIKPTKTRYSVCLREKLPPFRTVHRHGLSYR